LKEIKRRNEILVERLCKIKPVVSSQARPEKFNHIATNSKKRWINYRQAEVVRKQNEGMENRIQKIKKGPASFNHINNLYVVKET
jgi:acyl carrier protein phosphodiesterase